MPNKPIFLGLISGTSLDGVDAVAVEFDGDQPRLLASQGASYPNQLKADLKAICLPGANEIDRLGQLDRQVGVRFAETALSLLQSCNLKPEQITAIGCHGQTIRHRPNLETPFTLQIGDPNTISELTGITTVADFRRRDMAANGQGAPLVPAYHQVLFQHPEQARIILNLGGIANITCLPAGDKTGVIGYDTGPANTLLDRWIERYQDITFDSQGEWARCGKVNQNLLHQLLADDYFKLTPPKSTGTEKFNLQWLDAKLEAHDLASIDVQATLAELTAVSVANAIEREGYSLAQLLVCGGGVHNTYLMERLAYHLPDCNVQSTIAFGIDPDWVEAMTFAWLAKRTLSGLTGNLPSVTGATKEVILGGIYPAN
jgi:anhydro-N-acetylmuramic acid kinase